MYIDIERMKKALKGEPIEIPIGLKQESFNKFITSLGKCELKNSDFHLPHSTLGLVLRCYRVESTGERLGQWFCSNFIKADWPELFYEEEEDVAKFLIEKWLDNRNYVKDMPKWVSK